MKLIDQPIKLSDTDRAVLRAIQADAGATVRDLADRLGVSASTVSRRLAELEQVGAIKRRVALLDPDMVGYPVCVFVMVDLVDHAPETRAGFERLVQGTPEILECFSVTGTHDYTLIIRTHSVGEFEQILMERILADDTVAQASSQIALRQ
ncbi:MAG: Lrp/AsnC family transcriptional regulator, partial [Pseudomonadota bacterium]